ncbi:envelope stress response membrane protein PspC [Azospirillum sp.]|uniref:envelope stress response membrane protein PspC n=1 Tax=Azospirillum sp. TaxID=34012 RepID=UPI002D276101|nr:envelope stress response membrane protein PspC [Azospirillum sp.]HYD68565.1 envelope stress response membrane protein PspC [Azospirillum sp.]
MSRSPYDSPNPHRLYRNPQRGYMAGVCAGIGDYFGVDPFLVRLATVIGAMFFFPFVLVGYIIAALALPSRPPQLYRTPDEETFWRTVATKPDRSLAGLAQRFRDFEKRVAGLEAYVSSKDYELNKAFRDLER